MIGITLVMRAKPFQADALAAFWRDVARDVPAIEPGCLQISVMRSEDDPDTFVIFERYASQEAVDQHHASDFSRAMLPQLEALRIAPIQRIIGAVAA